MERFTGTHQSLADDNRISFSIINRICRNVLSIIIFFFSRLGNQFRNRNFTFISLPRIQKKTRNYSGLIV